MENTNKQPENDQNGSKCPPVDECPEISKNEKIWSGIILNSLILACLISIIALWPNRMPTNDTSEEVYYTFYFGNVTLISDSNGVNVALMQKYIHVNGKPVQDTVVQTIPIESKPVANVCIIGLNKLLLLLVALAGFLGNLIFLSASFTTFVAVEKFRRSWLLWYIVKPFSAAALSVIVYTAINAGFFSMNNFTSINLYGTIAFAFIVGLSTDRATEKLKELIEVFLKPAKKRADSIDEVEPKIIEVEPQDFIKDTLFKIEVAGYALGNHKLRFFIDKEPVLPKVWTDKKINIEINPEKKPSINFRIELDGQYFYSHELKAKESQ